MIIHFVETDEQYHNGVAIEEYEGKYSIVRANKGKDGQVYSKWGYPQYKKAPIETAIPWKIELGNKDQAISILQTMLTELGWRLGTNFEPVDDSGIPF